MMRMKKTIQMQVHTVILRCDRHQSKLNISSPSLGYNIKTTELVSSVVCYTLFRLHHYGSRQYVLRLQRNSYPAISGFRCIKQSFYNYVLYLSSCISIQRRYLTSILRVISLVDINFTRNEIILFLAHFVFHNTEKSFKKLFLQ